MKRYDAGIVAACLVIMACVLGAAIGGWVDMTDPGMPNPTTTTTTTLQPVADQPTNLPPPMPLQAAEVTATAGRSASIQVTEAVAPPTPVAPVPIPGDCNSWQAVFRWYGATDQEIYFFFVATPWGRVNVIWGETMCGLRFRNPATSDTGICQLNGVHRSWVLSEFGLRLGSGVSEAEASNPYYAAACLRLLRGGQESGIKGGCNWRLGRFCT